MQQSTQPWNKIFCIHEYFYKCGFSFEFVLKVFQDYRQKESSYDFPFTLFDFYEKMTGKSLAQETNFTSELFSKFQYLILAQLSLDSLYPVEQFVSLKHLIANRNEIDSVVPIKHLSHLIELDLSENKVTNLRPLAGLHSLQQLDLTANQIIDVSPISALENLKQLQLGANQIKNIWGLDKLKSLQQLDLCNNEVSSLKELHGLKSLKQLYLGCNPLPAEELVSIKKALPHCKISLDFYTPFHEGVWTIVELEIFQGTVFMMDYSRQVNSSYYALYYIEASNNPKPTDLKQTLKEGVLHFESSFLPEEAVLGQLQLEEESDDAVSYTIKY